MDVLKINDDDDDDDIHTLYSKKKTLFEPLIFNKLSRNFMTTHLQGWNRTWDETSGFFRWFCIVDAAELPLVSHNCRCSIRHTLCLEPTTDICHSNRHICLGKQDNNKKLFNIVQSSFLKYIYKFI